MFAFGDGAPRPLPRGAEPDDIAADFTAWEHTDVKALPLGDGSTPPATPGAGSLASPAPPLIAAH
jgi:hypothetical protein